MNENRVHDAMRSQAQVAKLQELRRRLAAGEITPEQAEAEGFPPTAPTKETR